MVRRQQAADRAERPKLRSPGHPKYQRLIEVAFWREIAKGLLAEEAAVVVGVAPAVGARWFRHAGGMPPFDLEFQPSGRYLSFAEREEMALRRAQGMGVREIARAISRDPGTVSRELRRNAATRGGKTDYRASVAQWKADMAAKRPKPAKLVTNPRLRIYVEDRLSGTDYRSRWHGHHRPGATAVHRTGQAASEGQGLVLGLESGADLSPVEDRLPG